MQNSFLALSQKKELRCERFLKEMNKVIPWDKFLKKIETYIPKQETGRKRYDSLLMLKIYFLQQWHNLSDPEAEEWIYDRNSFQKFLGIDLLSSKVPDETTILNFRHFLEEHHLQKEFFRIVNAILEKKGLILKEGTAVDATIIHAPSSTKNKDKKRDKEMSSTKKGNNWFFGMKAHIGVDIDSGLIHTFESTTASVHDIMKFYDLMHGDEKAQFGDKGYFRAENKRSARKNGVFFGVLDKAKRGHKLSSRRKKRNKKLSSVRARVEHPFQVLKCQWGYTKVRYKGLFKNTMNLYSLFALVNLFKARKKLIALS